MKFEDCNIGDIIEYRAKCGKYKDDNSDIQIGQQFIILCKNKNYHDDDNDLLSIQIKIIGKSKWFNNQNGDSYKWWIDPSGFIKINT
jgi:hypothetical protein